MRKTLRSLLYLFSIFLIPYSLFLKPAHAQVPIGEKFGAPLKKTEDVGNLVSVLISNAYILAGVLFLVLLLIGGFTVMTSAGAGNPEQAAKGWKIISAAFIGFLIIFVSYWIIQLIQLIVGFKIL